MTEQQLQRGDVVAYAGRYFVVWKLAEGEIEGFPITFLPYPAHGPFVVSIGPELASWGISDEAAAVSAAERELLVCSSSLRAIRVGRCSGGLICRIVGAATRAFAAEFIASRGRSECNNNSIKPVSFAAA